MPQGWGKGDGLKLPAARTRSRVCNNVLLRLTSVPPLPGGLACTVSAQGDRGFTPDPFLHKLQGSKSVSLSTELPLLVRAPDPIRLKALACGLVWQYVKKVLTCGLVWQYALSLNLYVLCCTRRLEREKQARAAAASEAQERAQMRNVAAQVRILPRSQDEGIYLPSGCVQPGLHPCHIHLSPKCPSAQKSCPANMLVSVSVPT